MSIMLGAAHKVVPISENRRIKLKRQNKIGGAHLCHVGIAMHAR